MDVVYRSDLWRVSPTGRCLLAYCQSMAASIVETDCKSAVHDENSGQHTDGQAVRERFFDLESFGEFFEKDLRATFLGKSVF